MNSTISRDILNSALEEVDSLFNLINSFPLEIRKIVLQKVKMKLEDCSPRDISSDIYDDSSEVIPETIFPDVTPNTESNSQQSMVVKKCRTSSRKRKITKKGMSFVNEGLSQSNSRKTWRKECNDSRSVEESESVKPCFVKLELVNESTQRSVESSARNTVYRNGESAIKTRSKNLNCENDDDYECDVDDPDYSFEDERLDEEKDDQSLNKEDIFKDVKKRGRKKKDNENGFLCEVCKALCKSQRLLMSHMRTHTNIKPFMCELCGKSFAQKQSLTVHLKRHNGIKSFECGFCDHRAVCKVDILRHMTKHTGERNYTCEYCGKLLTTDTGLYNHIKHVHLRSDKAFCNICDFATHSKDILRRHYLIKHTDNELFECPICSEVIKQKGSFMVHMRKHTGERPFHCSTCTKSFKSSSQLAAHRRIHREGEYLCETCKRKFKTKDHLKRHEIIHTTEKPYNCHLCAYACNVKGNLTKHIKSIHHISSFTFKEPYRKCSDGSLGVEASKRGSIAAEEYLKELTVNAGEVLTVEDLQKESKEMRELLQEAKLEEIKKKKRKNEKGAEAGTPIVFLRDAVPTKISENNPNSMIPSDSVTDSPDLLSNAVELLNAPISDVQIEKETPVSSSNAEYETIPFEIGSNMFIIQVVSDQDPVYLPQ